MTSATPAANANVISRRLSAAGHFRFFFAHGFHVSTKSPGIVDISVSGYTPEERDEEIANIAATLITLGYNASITEHTFTSSTGSVVSYPIVRVTG